MLVAYLLVCAALTSLTSGIAAAVGCKMFCAAVTRVHASACDADCSWLEASTRRN